MASKITGKLQKAWGMVYGYFRMAFAMQCLPFGMQMGYQMVFLLAPGMLVLIGLLNLLGSDPATLAGIVSLLKAFMPENLGGMIDQQVGTLILLGGGGAVLSIGFLIGFWLGMSLIGTITRALNQIHGTHQSPKIWARYFLSALLLFWFVVLVLGSFNLMLFGEQMANAVEDVFQLRLPLGGLVGFLKYPAVAVALCLMASALFLVTPEEHLKWREVLPGAIFFAVGWIVFTWGFRIYVENFARYAEIYLALAGFIILMFWSYVTSLCFLFGAVLNEYIRRKGVWQEPLPLALPERAEEERVAGEQ